MNKLISLVGILIVVGVAISLASEAATTASVTATVTAQNVAISVADASVAYGTIAVGGSASTSSDGVNDSQTATNDGNVSSDIDIAGTDSANWTLASARGSNQYVHGFCTSNCDTTPTWTNLTTSYASLASSVAAAGTQLFDLRIKLPSATTFYTQQSVNVSVQISAA